MPQADIFSFQSTLLLLPAVFLVGYYFFATVWVPRLLLTFKVRHWCTQVSTAVVWPVTLSGDNLWSETFLMFVQFAGLIWVLSTLPVTPVPVTLSSHSVASHTSVTYAVGGGTQVENFFWSWTHYRSTLFFAPAATTLTVAVVSVLQNFTFYIPGKQLPFLLHRFNARLLMNNLYGLGNV